MMCVPIAIGMFVKGAIACCLSLTKTEGSRWLFCGRWLQFYLSFLKLQTRVQSVTDQRDHFDHIFSFQRRCESCFRYTTKTGDISSLIWTLALRKTVIQAVSVDRLFSDRNCFANTNVPALDCTHSAGVVWYRITCLRVSSHYLTLFLREMNEVF